MEIRIDWPCVLYMCDCRWWFCVSSLEGLSSYQSTEMLMRGVGFNWKWPSKFISSQLSINVNAKRKHTHAFFFCCRYFRWFLFPSDVRMNDIKTVCDVHAKQFNKRECQCLFIYLCHFCFGALDFFLQFIPSYSRLDGWIERNKKWHLSWHSLTNKWIGERCLCCVSLIRSNQLSQKCFWHQFALVLQLCTLHWPNSSRQLSFWHSDTLYFII